MNTRQNPTRDTGGESGLSGSTSRNPPATDGSVIHSGSGTPPPSQPQRQVALDPQVAPHAPAGAGPEAVLEPQAAALAHFSDQLTALMAQASVTFTNALAQAAQQAMAQVQAPNDGPRVAAPDARVEQQQPVMQQAPPHSGPETRSATPSTDSGSRGADRSSSDNSKPQIARFGGDDKNVRVEAWLNLYEVATRGKSDENKAFELIKYLTGSAITWFSEEIAPDINHLSWDTVKSRMAFAIRGACRAPHRRSPVTLHESQRHDPVVLRLENEDCSG